MSANVSVSPQAAAVAAEWATAAAAQAPVPPTPPGMQPEPEQYVFNTPRKPANIDQQIAEVEDRLNLRISQIMEKMNGWSVQLNERFDRLLSATPPAAAAVTPEAAVAAPLGPAVAAASMAAPGPAQRLDPWSQSLEAARLPSGPPALTDTRSAAPLPVRGASLRGPLKLLHIKDVVKPKIYNGWGSTLERAESEHPSLRERARRAA